ncbi:MAG: transporter substrate-binding domain-containing protein [Kordiimonadaceae bacterium]|nr:transporter substrate-binding domain-containing protein [Kordiimonadaceae bacterium]
MTVASVRPQPRPSDHVTNQDRALGFELAEASLLACGVKAEFITYPSWTRAMAAATKGYVDALIPTNSTPDRQSVFYFPTKHYTSVSVRAFVHQKAAATRFTDWNMFDGTTIAHISGSRLSEEFDRYKKTGKATILGRSTLESLFEALMLKEIDYAVGQISATADLTRPLGSRGVIRALEGSLGETPLYVAISKKGKFAADTTHLAFRCLMD